ncbi:MAG: DUF4249 domain-containing protein [Bacteroidia bacterium]
MKKLIYFLLLLFTLSACRETIISTTDLNLQEKLVLGCFISPDDIEIQATLTRSKPLYRRDNSPWDFPAVSNATITITDGESTGQLLFDSNRQGYVLATSSFPIVAGKTYTMQINTPDGKSVRASCTVPSPFNPDLKLDVIALASGPSQVEDRLRINASWINPPGAARYFRFNYAQIFDFQGTPDTSWANTYIYSEQFIDQSFVINNRFVFSDLAYSYNWRSGRRIMGQLQEMDVHSYRYFSSLRGQALTGGDGFSEPTVIYSNVEDGIGCFGAHYTYNPITVDY